MLGDKLYQQRARQALPILVRQAYSRKPIFYENLAAELGMPNPRNLNWVLGSVGVSLNELAARRSWKGEIPHIQSLVINQRDEIPGSGFEGFLANRGIHYERFDNVGKRAYLEGYWSEIFGYSRWPEVLAAFSLKAVDLDHATLLDKAKRGSSGGGGEGPAHRALKEYVCSHPSAVGLPPVSPKGHPEAPLPSGDRLDVLFNTGRRMLGVEVKSHKSNDVDLIRGLFQCVKYQAVMLAERGFLGARYSVDTTLVVGRPFPEQLIPLRNSLGVKVIELLNVS